MTTTVIVGAGRVCCGQLVPAFQGAGHTAVLGVKTPEIARRGTGSVLSDVVGFELTDRSGHEIVARWRRFSHGWSPGDSLLSFEGPPWAVADHPLSVGAGTTWSDVAVRG